MLGSGKFWGVVAVMFVLGLFIEHPIAGVVVLGCLVAVFLAFLMSSWRDGHRVAQTMPVNGVATPVKQLQCGGCQKVGTLHVERRELMLGSGRMTGWSVAVCESCGYEEEAPRRLG